MRGYKESTLRVLREMEASPEFPGTTLAPTLTFLFWWTLTNHPGRILQCGTLIGYSALVLADAASDYGGRLFSLDPDTSKTNLAQRYLYEAGLSGDVSLVVGATHEPVIVEALAQLGPYDLIYLDTSHYYADTVNELTLLTSPEFLSRNGMLVLHDTSRLAQSWDVTYQGGVRRALREFQDHQARQLGLTVSWFDPPFFADTSGMALIYADRVVRDFGSNNYVPSD